MKTPKQNALPKKQSAKKNMQDDLHWSGEDMQYRKRGENGKADAGSAITGKDMRPEESASPDRKKAPHKYEQQALKKGGKIMPKRKSK